MTEDSVTVAEAMDQVRNGQVYDYDFLMNLRRLTLDQLAVYEQQMGLSPTTSEKLYWLSVKGPCDAILLRQVRHAKEHERDRVRYRSKP
jgi:hypothetical protein